MHVSPRCLAAKRSVARSTMARSYATQSTLGSSPNPSNANRRQVTITSDDGRIRWGDLSAREKAARTTQQSFNFLIIAAGVVGTGAVAYCLWGDVFSFDSKTAHFNRAVTRIKDDQRCVELLGGPADEITAFGEPSWNRLQRNRHLGSREEKDKYGTDHLYIRFYVQGSLNSGTVYLHMTKRPSEHEHIYHSLALEVKGHQRIYIENADDKGSKRPGLKMFGVRW